MMVHEMHKYMVDTWGTRFIIDKKGNSTVVGVILPDGNIIQEHFIGEYDYDMRLPPKIMKKQDNRIVSFINHDTLVALENYMTINSRSKSDAIRFLLTRCLESTIKK
jgi:hypothetical protein